MRKFTLLLLSIILIGAAGWGVMMLLDDEDDDATNQTAQQPTQQTPEPEQQAEDEDHVVVTYTDEGFKPSTVSVPVGGTVMFMNESGKSMWPASDLHPTHQIYSEFDPKKGFGEGESYEFTFTKKGEWGYHNHLSSGDTGTVVVE